MPFEEVLYCHKLRWHIIYVKGPLLQSASINLQWISFLTPTLHLVLVGSKKKLTSANVCKKVTYYLFHSEGIYTCLCTSIKERINRESREYINYNC